MNKIIKMIYQWHQGGSVKGIERSFGNYLKTVRKYVRLAQSISFVRRLNKGSTLLVNRSSVSRIRGLRIVIVPL